MHFHSPDDKEAVARHRKRMKKAAEAQRKEKRKQECVARYRKRLKEKGVEVKPLFGALSGLCDFLEREEEKWKKIIRDIDHLDKQIKARLKAEEAEKAKLNAKTDSQDT